MRCLPSYKIKKNKKYINISSVYLWTYHLGNNIKLNQIKINLVSMAVIIADITAGHSDI